MSKDTTAGHELIDGVWWNMDTHTPERIQDLIPTDWPLHFHPQFVLEVATNPNLDSMGIYTNGWEL